MNVRLRPYFAAVWLFARVALAAPDAATQSPPVPPVRPAAAPSSALTLAKLAPRARSAKPVDMVDNPLPNGPVVNGPGVTLYHGEVQVLDLPDVARIAVGNGGVLRAQVAEPGQVILIGEGAGTTSLRVWGANGTQYTYEVTVRSDDTARILRDVQDMLSGEPGLSVRQVDGHVLIEGDYSAPNTAAKIEAILKIYPQVVSIAPARKPAPAVALDRMVHMDVRVVEIRKSALDRLGVNWAATATGPQLGGRYTTGTFPMLPARLPNTGYFGIATNLTSVLDLLGQSGDSWTLAEPKVSCKSGGEAKFVVGGEIPVPVSAGFGATSIVYKKYGIILEFKPIADDKGNVSSSIVAEVSEPDQTFSNANGLIAFRQNRTETEVSLKENETLVISGLLRNSGSSAVNGIPGLKELPVLGALFRSKEFQNERTELVVLVTPRAIDARADSNVVSIHQADQYEAGVTKNINRFMAE
jgi:pilus assembly protein CpaC